MSNVNTKVDNNLCKLIFIDIETVPIVNNIEALSDEYKEHWKHKVLKQMEDSDNDKELSNLFDAKAGIFAEFGKIICIGLGLFEDDSCQNLRLKSISNDDEKQLLKDFFDIIVKLETTHQVCFVGHNIKEFDLAYICRRAIIHSLPLPKCLMLSNFKPWQNPHIDTMEMWRFGDYKNYTSLDLLATCLGVPSSKSDISGKDVARVYYQEKDLARIAKYCLQDVFTTALIYLRLTNSAITMVNPIFVDSKS